MEVLLPPENRGGCRSPLLSRHQLYPSRNANATLKSKIKAAHKPPKISKNTRNPFIGGRIGFRYSDSGTRLAPDARRFFIRNSPRDRRRPSLRPITSDRDSWTGPTVSAPGAPRRAHKATSQATSLILLLLVSLRIGRCDRCRLVVSWCAVYNILGRYRAGPTGRVGRPALESVYSSFARFPCS